MTVGVGVIGYGFIGRTHAAAYQSLRERGVDCELRGIYAHGGGDAGGGNIPALSNVGEISNAVTAFDSIDDMLRDESIDLVSICTPTDTHVDIAVQALTAAKHVLLEKPVALSVASMQPLLAAAAQSTHLCMPAHCMRFWPGWPEAREIVGSGRFGSVIGAHFRRVAQTPSWNAGFYLDARRSGGALFDLHVHDADFLLWCFGEPAGVRARGSIHHAFLEYAYPGYVVTAEGAWLEGDASFEMKYRIELESGTLDFSFDRADPLIVHTASGSEPWPVAAYTAYENQAEYAVRWILEGRDRGRVTLADATRVIGLLERIRGMLDGAIPGHDGIEDAARP